MGCIKSASAEYSRSHPNTDTRSQALGRVTFGMSADAMQRTIAPKRPPRSPPQLRRFTEVDTRRLGTCLALMFASGKSRHGRIER